MQPLRPGSDERFADAIQNAIQQEIAKIADEEAAAAAERVHQRARERINEIAVRLFSQFSIERHGPDLVIRVLHEEKR